MRWLEPIAAGLGAAVVLALMVVQAAAGTGSAHVRSEGLTLTGPEGSSITLGESLELRSATRRIALEPDLVRVGAVGGVDRTASLQSGAVTLTGPKGDARSTILDGTGLSLSETTTLTPGQLELRLARPGVSVSVQPRGAWAMAGDHLVRATPNTIRAGDLEMRHRDVARRDHETPSCETIGFGLFPTSGPIACVEGEIEEVGWAEGPPEH